MNDAAKVSSIEAIADFRVSLIKFLEEANTAIVSMQMEVNRSMEWLNHDRPLYWKRQVQKRYEQVTQARQDLKSCERRTVGGKKPDCAEEEKQLRKAKRRLQEAEELLDSIPRWRSKISRESDEYKGRMNNLERFLNNDLVRAVVLLERMSDILDTYTHSNSVTEVGSTAGSSTTTSQPENVAQSPSPSTDSQPENKPTKKGKE